MRTYILIIVAFVALLIAAVPAMSESTSELLEKGIYTEETVGDVDEAIEIYTRIVDSADVNRPLIAEALYRLGLCHLKNDNADAASEVFDRIITDYADQDQFVARARESMPEDPTAFEVLPAPWEDGEVMRLTLKLASGTPIGAMMMTADLADPPDPGDEQLWRLRVRRKIFSDADNQAISQVLVRQDGLLPVSSTFKHVIVGHYEASYRKSKAEITTVGKETTREAKLTGRVFDNEQGFHLFRALPLAEGYKKRVTVLAPWAGEQSAVEIEVTGTEMVSVPAGEFECYRLEFSVPQTFWYSTGPDRVLVKFEGAGIVGELDEVYRQDTTRDNVHGDNAVGYSVSAPPDWLFYPTQEHGVALFDPYADARSELTIHRTDGDRDACSCQGAAYRTLQQFKQRFQGFALRDGTWTEARIDGRPSVSFVADYVVGDREVALYWTYVDSGALCAEFTMHVGADRFDDLREEFDAIIAGYEGPRPTVVEQTDSVAVTSVKAVITDFHLAASHANTERYFGHMAPDFVFLGTDRSERFDIDQLREIAEPSFSKGNGWVAKPTELNVVVSDDETMAWFDERLESANFGEMRASGTLRKDGATWRIVQYNVGFAVPNDLVGDLIERMKALDPPVDDPPVDFATTVGESGNEPENVVKEALTDFHRAASDADEQRYLGYLAPDAIYMGTDRAERFTVEGVRAFVGPYLSRGMGWKSVPVDQKVFLSPDENIAWFEERLQREGVGELRGTGVMRKVDGEWRIVHYNLMLPVPNELAEHLVGRIRSFYGPT